MAETKNETAWEEVFEKYDVLEKLKKDKAFEISAAQIKDASRREPRLMAKIDHEINMPRIFKDNSLSILPTARGEYVISHGLLFNEIDCTYDKDSLVKKQLPDFIKSITPGKIPSETIALNSAFDSGMIQDFVDDVVILPTAEGRMSSDSFEFKIRQNDDSLQSIRVKEAQMEIDATYETTRDLIVFEAKNDLCQDFVIRQLYYPFRALSRFGKHIRPIFLVYSDGVFEFFEYRFKETYLYNSITLVKKRCYTLEDRKTISKADIRKSAQEAPVVKEDMKVPFPQADKFEKLINLTEIAANGITKDEIAEKYDFDIRQSSYYSSAGKYLGLLDVDRGKVSATALAQRILSLPYKERQEAFAKAILRHAVFKEILLKKISGLRVSKADIIRTMHGMDLNLTAEETYRRRAETVDSWTDWIMSLASD